MKPYLAFILLVFGMAGCAHNSHYTADRTARLREMYPPGMSKADVQSKWGQSKPDFSATRPADGWSSYQNKFIADMLGDMETRTGKTLESVERYWGPDGFLSLAYCWYYYDPADKLVDVAWQYKSD